MISAENKIRVEKAKRNKDNKVVYYLPKGFLGEIAKIGDTVTIRVKNSLKGGKQQPWQ